MRHVVIVGPQTAVGREVGLFYAKEGAKIAFVSSNDNVEVHAQYRKEALGARCQEQGATVAFFSGNLGQRSEWAYVYYIE